MGVQVDYIAIAVLSYNRLNAILEEFATEKVTKFCCHGHPCPQLCDTVRHDIKEVTRQAWPEYAKRN